MKRPAQAYGAATALVVLLGLAEARADDWPNAGLDVARNRQSSERIGSAFSGAGWRHQTTLPSDAIMSAVVSAPAVADGFVVFATYQGVVSALRARDGHLAWSFSAKDGIQSSPTIHRGRVYVGSFDRTLYALNLSDGTVLWSYGDVGILHGSASTVTDDLGDGVVCATGFPHRRLVRLDAANGKVIWTSEDGALDRSSNASVAIAGGRIIVGTMGGHHHAFDARTGRKLWTHESSGLVHMASPTVHGDRVFFLPGGDDANLHSLSVATGHAAEGWPVTLSPPKAAAGVVLAREHTVSSPIVAAGLIIVQVRFTDLIDGNKDMQADLFEMSEQVFGVDPLTGIVRFRTEVGHRRTNDINQIPGLGLSPTPAAFHDASGGDAVVVASTLSPSIRLLQLPSGIPSWLRHAAAPSRSSPSVANARVFLATDAGTVEAWGSSQNRAPSVANTAEVPRVVRKSKPVLAWTASVDPDGDAVSYRVRLDRDGEVLQDWQFELDVAAGQTQVVLPAEQLALDEEYGFAIRARDSRGAWSDWTDVGFFRMSPVDGEGPAPPEPASADEWLRRLAEAQPGDVVRLGPGQKVLQATARLKPGVTLAGAGPSETTLIAAGLPVAVTVEAGASAQRGTVTGLTIKSGAVGVDVAEGAHAALDHVIVVDAAQVGVRARSASRVDAMHVTIARTGTAMHADASAVVTIANSIMHANVTALEAGAGGQIVSRYNALSHNRQNYAGVPTGVNDVDAPIPFDESSPDVLEELAEHATVDRGDPGSDHSQEPDPNGGRVNIGAYGNTAKAAPSPFKTTPDGGPPSRPPAPHAQAKPHAGCEVGAAQTGPRACELVVILVVLALLALRRRAGKSQT